jgi:hypothetical protein
MNKNEKAKTAFEGRLLAATAESAIGAVREVGARGEALVQAWLDAPNAAAVLEVSEHGDGTTRKAARRALNVLRARKVPIPELHRTAALPTTADVVEGWMMAPDSSGMQLFAISSRSASGRYRVVFVFLHGSQGVARIENANMSQSQLKDYFGKILPGAGYSATRVPVEWARYRIADARRMHRGRGLPEPLGFTTAATLIEPLPADPPTHPFDDEGFELGDEDATDFAKGSASLHNIPEFRSWLPTSEAMQELLTSVGEKLTPGETPEPSVVTEHLRTEGEAATDRFFSPDLREEVVRRMKDSALSALAREGEQRALEISAVIKVIEKCGLVTNPPRDVPFLRAFFDKAVALMLAQGGGRLRIPMPPGTIAREPAAPSDAGPAAPSNVGPAEAPVG